MKDEAQKWIGKLLPEGIERDAVHFAVLPAIAGKDLYYGDTCIYDPVSGKAYPCSEEDAIGIVDPFLRFEDVVSVSKGDRFFIYLKPNTIVGLRHHWFHPEIDKKLSTINESEQYIREFAMEHGASYESTMEQLRAIANGERDYFTVSGQDASGNLPLEIWEHYIKVTGEKVSEEVTLATYSCSC